MKKWNKFDLSFDFEHDRLILSVNDHHYIEERTGLGKESTFKFLWGVNDFPNYATSDCPPLKLRNIRLFTEEKTKNFWPLNEISGNIARDTIGGQTANIENPLWIRSLHRNWNFQQGFNVNGAASVAFNAKKEILYIVADDSLWEYNVGTSQLKSTAYKSGKLGLLPSNESFYDTKNQTLYNYYIDKQQKQVNTYDFNTASWNNNYHFSLVLTDYWQTNNFFSIADTSLYIVGGYGQLTYKNVINRFHVPGKDWEQVNPKGAYYWPRYLAAAGTTDNGATAYFIGGYGSYNGQQMLNPKNLYDLMRFDVRTHTFSKIYELKPPKEDFVFANSMVIDEKKKTFSALVYPNYHYNSHLQLLIGNLNSPEYRLAGSEISYSFHDTHSFSNLYYSPNSQRLVAITLLRSEKNNQTTVRIYTLLYPPDLTENETEMAALSGWGIGRVLSIASIAVALCGMVVYYRKKRSLRQATQSTADNLRGKSDPYPIYPSHAIFTENHPVQLKNAIYLFGDLQFFDSEGNDLIKHFTSLIKELFLVVIIYTLRSGRGISPEKLIELLWADKSEDSAKNNRSANISKLKSILQQTGNISLSKESGNWKINIDHTLIYSDYYIYQQITANRKVLSREKIDLLIEIAERGSFLANVEYPWLDTIKSDISNEIVDILLEYAGRARLETEAEFLVKLASCVFSFDSVNEEAMVIKCKSLAYLGKHSLAKSTFEIFLKEFRTLYGEEFKKNFHVILESSLVQSS